MSGNAWMNEGVFDGLVNMTAPFGMAINLGLAPGYEVVQKFAVNTSISAASAPEDVIEQGGLIQYDDRGTAPIKYLSSSSAADVGLPIDIQGLDIDGNKITETLISNGQNVVELITPLWRAYRMHNDSADDAGGGADVLGIMYLHTDATPTAGVPALVDTRLIINGSKNQTFFGGFTIPKGKVGMLFRGEAGIELEGSAFVGIDYAHVHYKVRLYGKRFRVRKAFNLITAASSNYNDERTFPDALPALTDVHVTVDEVTTTMGCWTAFDILLVDENKCSKSWLKQIEQPGY